MRRYAAVVVGLCLCLVGCLPDDGSNARSIPILRAALDRDHTQLLSLAQDRSALAVHDRWGRTALIIAARQRDLRSIQILLAAGADPNQRVASGWGRVLHAAAAYPHNTAVLQALLSAGADPNGLGPPGCVGCCLSTPLGAALYSGDSEENVRVLLAAGANINPQQPACTGTLMYAIRELKLVRMFLDAGVDPNQTDSIGSTALHRACTIETIKLLLQRGAHVELKDQDGWTPIAGLIGWCGGSDLTQALRTLVAAGADPLVIGKDGGNLLHIQLDALRYWSAPETVQALLELGVPINSRDKRGRTPLARWQEPRIWETKSWDSRLSQYLSEFDSIVKEEQNREQITKLLIAAGATE